MTLGSQNGPESFHTREDLTAGSDEFRSRPLPCTRLVSAGLDLPRTGEPGLLGLGPSALETMMLPVAVERSVSPAVLVIERSSAEFAGPSWMAGRRTSGPSPYPGHGHGICPLRPGVRIWRNELDESSVGKCRKHIDLWFAPLGKHWS